MKRAPNPQPGEQSLTGPKTPSTQPCPELQHGSPTPTLPPPLLSSCSIPSQLQLQNARSMESLLAGNPTSRPINSPSKHIIATWCRTSPQRMGYIESIANWCWCFHHNMKRWGLRPSAACICGHTDQTAHHVIHDCPTLRKHYHEPDQPKP